MRKLAILFLAGAGLGLAAARAVDLKESKFTQVVNDVQVVSTADNSKRPAAVDAIFKLPDVVRTGAASRAELVADDRTITRIGANTIFSFDQASRTIRLDQGSLLFNSPKGKGGGSIHTTAATAAVLGTTIIVTTTPDGGFKVLVLEGKAEVKFLNGVTRSLKAGQMVFVLPGSLPGPVVVFRLDQQVAGSQLVNGFSTLLPTLPLINQEVARQIKLISSGRAADTGLLVGSVATPTSVQTVQIFNELNASPGASNGVAPGLNGGANGTPTGGGAATFTLPPGFVVPPGLNFDPFTGGFLTTDGLLFIAAPIGGSNGVLTTQAASTAALASLSDSTVTAASTLDPARFYSDNLVIIDSAGTHPGINGGGFVPGYIARNLTFNNSALNLSGANQSIFEFIAAQTMSFSGVVVMSNSPQILLLAAGSGFQFAAGSSLTSDSQALFFYSPTALTLDSAVIKDTGGSGSLINFTPLGTLTLNNTTLLGSMLQINGGGAVNISGSTITSTDPGAGGAFVFTSAAINVSDTFISAPTVALNSSGSSISVTGKTHTSGGLTATSGIGIIASTGITIGVDINATAPQQNQTTTSLSLQTTTGLVTVNNGAHFTADFITVNSPGGILFGALGGPAGTVTANAGGSATFTAGNVPGDMVKVENSSFNGLGSVSISAHTVVLNNVDFAQGTTVSLGSFNGLLAPGANTGQAIVPGDVNYIQNVTYGGQAAQNFTGVISQPITLIKN